MVQRDNSQGVVKGSRIAWEWGHLLLMMAVAAYFRFPGLGALSFYGDEELSALAVQGILSNGFPHMPSGMAYWRGAPYSYLAAGSALLFGLTEFSIRLPSAIFGVLTIPIFYRLAKRLIGLLPAALAAWLLVFSAWHIDMSREGRMYVMFLAFFLLSLLCLQRGFLKKQRAFRVIAILVAVITLMLHELGIFLIALWCIPLLFNMDMHRLRDKVFLLVTAVGLSIFWFGYQRFAAFVVPGTTTVRISPDLLNPLAIGFTPKFWMLSHILDDNAALFAVLFFSSTLMLYWVWKAYGNYGYLNRYIIIGSVALVTLAIFNLFGLIALGLLLLLFWRGEKNRELLRMRYCQWIILEITAIVVFWFFYGLMIWRGEGVAIVSEIDLLRKVVKDSLYYPALHIIPYLEAFPIMTVIVSLGTLVWGFIYYKGRGTNQLEAVMFPWFWLPLLALGFKKEWVYLRHTVMLYPFYVMIFAWTMYQGLCWARTVMSRSTVGVAFGGRGHPMAQAVALSALMLVVPVMNEQHSIRAAMQTSHLSYKQSISPLWHGFPFHPDHKSPGEYVKANLKESDVIIAMDLFQQYYYIGRVDYWLRGASHLETYCCYREGNAWYDIYTKTPVITRKDQLEGILNGERDNRVWLITSGELAGKWSNLFPSELIELFPKSDSNLVFVGRDNETRVYLFKINERKASPSVNL